MKRPSLTVVIPSRNRPESLLRLLKSLAGQSLSPAEFEVVVVDDGSEPPLNASRLAKDFAFLVRVARRAGRPGAHESRFAGLRQASGERVLFLDDDVLLEPGVLAEHAAVHGALAVGPIFYHPDVRKTPYQRFATESYAMEANAVLRAGSNVPTSYFYICNASGPTELFAEIFARVQALTGDAFIPGDGCDEELLVYALRTYQHMAQVLPTARVLHLDTKTVAQVRRERQLHGRTECLLMLRCPEIRKSFNSYAILTGSQGTYRSWRVRLFWSAPLVFRVIANAFVWLADHGPTRWVPARACRPPLKIAFWEGMISVAPSFNELRAALLAAPGGLNR